MRDCLIVGLIAAVLIAAVAAPLTRAEDADSIKKKLEETRITQDFKETPLGEVVDLLSKETGVNIVIDPAAVGQHRTADGRNEPVRADAIILTLDVKGQSAADVLDRLSMDWKLSRLVREELVLIVSRRAGAPLYSPDTAQPGVDADVRKTFREKLISARFEDMPLPKLLEKLGEQAERRIVLEIADEYLQIRPMTIELKDVSLAGWLDVLCCISNATWTVRDGEVLLSDRTMSPADLATLKRLDETKVSFAFKDQPIMEALDFLQTLGRISVVPDRTKFEDPGKTITLTAKNVTLREAWDRLCEQAGLRWVVRNGVVLIVGKDGATDNAADSRPAVPIDKRTAADRALIFKLRETLISFTFTDKPVLASFSELQKIAGVPLVIDRSKLNNVPPTVTLKLIDAPADTALRLMVDQLGLDFAVIKGKVQVSDSAELRKLLRSAYGKD